MGTLLLTGFLLGITSNLHCIGMCGPIAMAIPVNRSSNWSILGGIFQYNIGRILTYSLLGAVVGSIGITIETFGILQWISILSGVFLIIFAWRKWFSLKVNANVPSLGLKNLTSKGMHKVLSSDSSLKLTLLGMLNGLLPCGMVSVALMNALIAGNPVSSAYTMIAFGIGTLPAMIAVGFAANRIGIETRKKLNKVVPYLLTVVGLLVILRGMNLDIPYLSPKVSITVASSNDEPKVEMSCCHKSNACKK
jgi:sulfite exporter TauE/SafE